MRALGRDGRIPSDSSVGWMLDLTADKLPSVNAFWSVTMSRATPAGQFCCFDEPIDRYAIRDRTPGLVRDRAGGVSVWMTRPNPDPRVGRTGCRRHHRASSGWYSVPVCPRRSYWTAVTAGRRCGRSQRSARRRLQEGAETAAMMRSMSQ